MDAKLSWRSELRRRLLEYFVAHPGAEPHVHLLARILVLDSANLAREMVRLERLGLLKVERRANRKHYRLNRQSALYRSVKDAISRTTGAIPELEKALGRTPGVEFAWLYGTCVRRRHDPRIPLDLLILGRPAPARLHRTIREMARRLGREIHFTVLAPQEFAALRKKGDERLADFHWAPKIDLFLGP
jgi:predicted nucleotidyltransferase